MGNFINYNRAQGVQNPQQGLIPPAIIAARAPTVDDAAVPGQFWLYQQKNATAGYINIGSIAGDAQWGPLDQPIGNVFATITVNPGPTDLTGAVNVFTGPLIVTGNSDFTGLTFINTAGAAATSIGNAAANTFIDGNVRINDNINSNTNINTGTSNGTVNIGNLVNAGQIEIETTADLLVTAGGAVAITSVDNIAGSLSLNSAAGGIEVLVGTTALYQSTGTTTLQSTGAKVNVIGGDATLTAVHIENGNVGGGITVEAGTSGLSLKSSNATATAVNIEATSVTGGVTVTSTGGGISLDSQGGGGLVLETAAATPLTVTQGANFSSIFVGAGAPGFATNPGSLYICTNGANNNQVLYVNFDGGLGNWAPLTI